MRYQSPSVCFQPNSSTVKQIIGQKKQQAVNYAEVILMTTANNSRHRWFWAAKRSSQLHLVAFTANIYISTLIMLK